MKAEAQIKIEGERESRKAKEAEDAAENQRKRAEIDGKTALLLEGLKASIDTLVADQERVSTQFEASRNNSQRMGATVEDTNKTAKDTNSAVRETRHMVEDIHRALIS